MMKIKKSMTSHDNVGLTVDYRNFVVIFIPDQCQNHAMSASMYFIRRLNREHFYFFFVTSMLLIIPNLKTLSLAIVL